MKKGELVIIKNQPHLLDEVFNVQDDGRVGLMFGGGIHDTVTLISLRRQLKNRLIVDDNFSNKIRKEISTLDRVETCRHAIDTAEGLLKEGRSMMAVSHGAYTRDNMIASSLGLEILWLMGSESIGSDMQWLNVFNQVMWESSRAWFALYRDWTKLDRFKLREYSDIYFGNSGYDNIVSYHKS